MTKLASVLILISIALFTVNAVPQCATDIQNQITNNTVCQSGDKACSDAYVAFIACFTNCGTANSSDSAIKSCLKTNCSNISNTTVQAFYNKMMACFDSVLLFSVIFILIALLF
ncbi:hypothetical protein ABPG74_007837 [Tetrahymena malaccensis]